MDISTTTVLSQETQTNENSKVISPNTSSLFDTMITQNKSKEEEKKDEQAILDKLLEDIKSVMRTGLTTNELEELEKMKKEIQEKIKAGADKDEIEKLIIELEDAIAALKKRLSAHGIEKKDSDEKMQSKAPSSSGKDLETSMEKLEERLENIEKDIELFKNSKAKKEAEGSSHDTLQLMQSFQNPIN